MNDLIKQKLEEFDEEFEDFFEGDTRIYAKDDFRSFLKQALEDAYEAGKKDGYAKKLEFLSKKAKEEVEKLDKNQGDHLPHTFIKQS